jgi:ATP-dependent Lon protease
MFVNNASGKIGLVGYWDCICFDEFAGKDKNVDKNLVDIMKNFMANKSFSRGIEQLTAEASMVFMGNTTKTMEYMLKHSYFFEPLPDKYIDSAFLDRLHAYSPGWEVPPVRNELFTSGYGFIVDYLAEILKHQRTEDFTGAYKERFEIVSELSTRDQTGFEKTFSGLMKLLYPNGEATDEEMEELVAFSMECRRRVREHILRIDDAFARHDFIYRRVHGGLDVTVLTPEEKEFPTYAAQRLRTLAEPEELGQDTERQAPEAESSVGSRVTIAELIAMGESKEVEFKSSARWSYGKGERAEVVEQAIVRTVAAFLNTSGGTLLIGVRDDGEPIGLEKDYKLTKGSRDSFENWLTDLLEGAFGKPPVAGLSVSFRAIDGNDVCRVDVEASSSPVFVKRGNDRDLFVRFNNSTRQLNAEDVLQYVGDHFKPRA